MRPSRLPTASEAGPASAGRHHEPSRRGRRALRGELDATLRELRELVRGVLPATLVERGLGAAADELADRMPVPTRVEAGDERYPAAVESTGRFVISEALANVVKHADADAVTVRVARDEHAVRIEVREDGRGSGLRGIADRADVHGGRIAVESPPSGGTRIVAVVPCGS